MAESKKQRKKRQKITLRDLWDITEGKRSCHQSQRGKGEREQG